MSVKNNVLQTCDGILFSLKNKKNSDICYNIMKLAEIMLIEINQQKKKDKYCMMLLS